MLDTKHFILIWIVIILIFLYYCLYRGNLFAMRDTTSPFADTSIPTSTTPQNIKNIIGYLDDIQAHNKITDIPGCQDVFDDNVAVRSLGYNSCNTAYADYFNKNLDPTKPYGNNKTLADICPVSSKSDKYMTCMRQLMNKFKENGQMSIGVVNDLSELINQRLTDRNNILAGIETDMNPYLFNSELTQFQNANLLGESQNASSLDKLNLVNNYYQNKLGVSHSVFANTPTREYFTSLDTIDPYLVDHFLGFYKPIKGQFLAFNNITISLNHDNTTTSQESPMTTQQEQQSQQSPQNNKQTGPIVLNIVDDATNAMITYKVSNLDYYQGMKNVVKLEISGMTISTEQPDDAKTLHQLITTLGLNPPTRVFIMIEKTKSTEGKEHISYKMLNIGMDTIMVMEKSKI